MVLQLQTICTPTSICLLPNMDLNLLHKVWWSDWPCLSTWLNMHSATKPVLCKHSTFPALCSVFGLPRTSIQSYTHCCWIAAVQGRGFHLLAAGISSGMHGHLIHTRNASSSRGPPHSVWSTHHRQAWQVAKNKMYKEKARKEEAEEMEMAKKSENLKTSKKSDGRVTGSTQICDPTH